MSTPDAEILEVFHEEAVERLDRMVETLLAIESGHASPDAVDSLFRDAHSIKGSAGMVGREDVRSIAHSIEDVLEGARERDSFSPDLVEPMLQATDALRRAIAPERDNRPADGPAAPVESQVTERRGMRVSTDKVDSLFDAVGETVLHRRRLESLLDRGVPDPEQVDEELAQGEALMGELQHSVIQMRTLPLSSITGSLPRAVRDLAAAEGKQVELVISGDETQLDRVILDGISEAISHLLSNAVVHGIEAPAERERAGKPALGRIELRGDQRGSLVAIEVRDDGRGVSPELLDADRRGATLVDTLTQAGFSTAEQVTEVAGRGVGLDAVKSHVESLGGGLEVESEPGRGTAVIMLLPLTLALLHVLVFERAGQPFGLPLTSVEEAIPVRSTMSLAGQEAIEVRGRSVRLADAADVLGARAARLDREAHAMVVCASARRVALLCDRIVEEQEVVVKSLGPLLAGVPGYLGAAIMHDGRIALILDPAFVTRSSLRGAATAAEQAKPVPRKVLVVDDQFTVRELQRSILEAAGFEVLTARDGREALASLTTDPDVELVVTDVQMPELDGMGLLRAIRESREHASLPVVMVTSRGSDEDRQSGLEAGADAYIVKDQFNQRALIQTVERLLAG